MANTPEQSTPTNTATAASTVKNTETKQSNGMGFKFSAALLVILAGLGASSYVAYHRGLANPYLPQILQKTSEERVALTPTEPALTSATTDSAPANVTPTVPSQPASVTDNATTATAQTSIQAPAPATNAVTVAPSVTPVAPTTTTPSTPVAPSVSIDNSTTNALLSIMDAQTQWQAMQFDFNQRWDTANALQTIQTLKNQLQALNNSAALPTIGALSQTEAQIQAWHAINPQAHLAALQQSLADVDKLQIRTIQTPAQEVAPTGVWARFMSTLKNIFAIKRVNTAQDTALDAANAAIVKQGIMANLMSAQWAARNGQWQSAQAQVRTANANIQSYGQGYTLDSLKPLMDANSFPTQPDFNTVQQALMQARAQLAAQMQSERVAAPTKANGATL